MPRIANPDLGEIDFREEEILDFPEGLPAFETLRRFLLVRKEAFAPFVFLLSVDSPEIRFVCVPMCVLDPGYSFELGPEDGAAAGLDEGVYSALAGEPLLLAIVTLPSAATATANLASPVVINTARRLGAQLILSGSAHSHTAPLRPAAAVEEPC